MHPQPDAPTPAPSAPRREVSRRASIIGTVIAILVLAGLAWLAWSLTRAASPTAATTRTGAPGTPAGTGAPGGPGGPGGVGGPGGTASRPGTPATTVGIATAALADLPVVLEALGTITPIATATVRAQVSGVLKELHFTEGQMVKAGQLLARIDPQQFEMSLMQATGQRMKDAAQLENAQLTLERFQKLLSLDSIARQEVDTQAALVKQLEATVVMSRAAEGTARINLAYTRIVAPISGRVGLRVTDVGNLVGANDAEGIAVITQLAPLDAEFSIPQDRMPEVQARLREGAKLAVEVLDRSRTSVLDRGTFASLDNQVDTQTGTVRAKARFTNAKLVLFPNQFVNVRLLLRTIQGAVVVPITALRHGSNGDFVYVLNRAERTVALRQVTRGQATAERVQIVTGLDAGEVVITEGADRLKDGARVILPDDAGRPPAAGERAGRAPNAGKSRGEPGEAGKGPAKNVSPEGTAPAN